MRKLFSLLVAVVILSGCSSSDDESILASIAGTVTDYETGAPLSNAGVTLSPSNETKQTAANGFFSFEGLEVQQYTLTVQKAGYQPNRKTVTTVSGNCVQVNIQLTQIPE